MSWYILALFAHIVGVLTLFISLALQWLCTLRVRRARSIAEVREWTGLARSLNRLAPVSGVLILGAGIYMTAIAWSLLTTWIDVSVAAMGVMMIFGMAVAGRQLSAIRRAAAQTTAEGSPDVIPAALQARMDDPALWVAMQVAVAVALSIVLLMTTKPNLIVSIVSVLVWLALGALVGKLTLRPRRQRATHSTALGVIEASVR